MIGCFPRWLGWDGDQLDDKRKPLREGCRLLPMPGVMPEGYADVGRIW